MSRTTHRPVRASVSVGRGPRAQSRRGREAAALLLLLLESSAASMPAAASARGRLEPVHVVGAAELRCERRAARVGRQSSRVGCQPRRVGAHANDLRRQEDARPSRAQLAGSRGADGTGSTRELERACATNCCTATWVKLPARPQRSTSAVSVDRVNYAVTYRRQSNAFCDPPLHEKSSPT